MANLTSCPSLGCPRRSKCLRYLGVWGTWRSVATFDPRHYTCFLPIKKYDPVLPVRVRDAALRHHEVGNG